MANTSHSRFQFFSLTNPILLSAALAIALLCFFTNVALRYIHASQERVVREHLQTSLNSFSELITIWQQQNLGALQMLATSAQGQSLLKQVLLEQGANPKTQAALRDWLYPVLVVMGFDGFSVMNHERQIVASSTQGYIKQPVRLPETMEVLDKALAKRPAISRPLVAVRPLEGPRGTQPAGTLMQIMCVLLESEVTTSGYFCLRFNTESSFFPIFLKGRTGRSGEIYAIDSRGSFVTPARFDVASGSTAQPPQIGTPVRQLVTEGAPEKLTQMVDFLISHQAGFIKVGYQDYRGKAVSGAGRWLADMELGIVVEQDVQEGMGPYLASRNIILGLCASAIALILVLTITAILNRRQLAMREGRFRSLLDNLPAATHMTSLDQQLIVVNPAFCQLLKLDKPQLIGKYIHELPIPAWLMPLMHSNQAADPQSYWRDDISELRDPDGNPRYYRIVRFPVVYAKATSPQAFACVWVDSTERVVANQRLAEVNQNLEHMVSERTRELMLAKDEAQAATQAKAEFLANMSHEIRTPLNAIIGLAHIALASNPEPKQRTYLEKMRGSGEHLLEIINDILNFSRMEAGKLTLDNSEFSIDQLIDKTVDLVWEKAAAKGLQISVDVAADIPPLLLGDALRLGQILINFCANAVKFTDHGKINIRVTQTRVWPDRVELLFEVEDTGIGIDAEKVQSLFQPFQQVDSSSARRFEGTGLGLSICKNLAVLMNGEINVTSAPEQGSCFRLRVQLDKPRLLLDSNSIQPAFIVPTLTPVHCHVLVVEDNALNQEIMESLLQSMGAQTQCVASGTAALAAVQQQVFDLVLMDIQLPGMDGVEATARIRALAQGKQLPIIAVTANALPGDRERYLIAGLDDYLSKPIEPAQLHRVIQHWSQASRDENIVAPDKAAMDVANVVPATNSIACLQQAGIDTARALHNLMNNESLYVRLLGRFASERAAFPQQLISLLENNQSEALNQVHSLKSLAASLGMNTLEVICFKLEQQLHTAEWSDVLVEQLNDELTRMVDLVRRCLPIKPE